MFSPTDPQVKNNLPKIKQIIMNSEVEMFVVPTPYLKNLVLKNEHPFVVDLPDNAKAAIMTEYGIVIEKSLVLKWLEGQLDEKNAFILNNSEIRVSNSGLILNKEKV